MSVKTIFKVLVGTIVLMVATSIILEMFNINTTSLQLQSISKMSARQACVFFGQETYKRSDYYDVNTYDIYTAEGGLAVSGTFYRGGSPEAIYNELYGTGSDFLSPSGPVKTLMLGKWESLDLLVKKNDELGIGQYFADSLMTPLNVGVPYMDEEVVNKIFQWNLAAILNNGQFSGNKCLNVHSDGDGNYVLYKGFKVYVNSAKITDIDYIILDLTKASDRQKFQDYTNMDANVYLSNGAGSDERSTVCLAGIEYSVPMKYVGITPFKRIMEFGWNQQVKGMNDNPDAGTSRGLVWNDDDRQSMQSGGLNGSAEKGILPVPGDLIYYIVR